MGMLGNITVSPTVIKQIILETIKEIPNVIGIAKESKNQISGFFKSDGQKHKELEVEMSDTECVIDLSITVEYGAKLMEVAENLQEVIAKKVEELSGLSVKEINVVISKVEKRTTENVPKERVENV
ncbi:Asp23/Gls24 family envelope stress response protein [Oceanivirga salmonicida]|uniref:Asp23/Gls24 family envelope stress response protein n=1 Tax=Oceanivirga salmonicida TaxID=1769291 RepID=UPI00082F04F4|nr:Asp23/Gls24 family envelope stress response protein [Oceanivirga salmonicida]